MGRAGGRRSRRSSDASGTTQRAPSEPSLAAPATGEVVGGKYRIEGLLGQGGMGAVYRATHVVSGKRVAVKWMLPARGEDDLADRFVREARATARIDHPNVVDVYDVGSHEGSVYLVMELLHGESLADRLERGPMEPSEAVGVLMHALRAVAAAHAEGVIHRDLKPDNIFLCQGPDGEPREPKVLDFGISKIASGNDMRDMSLTQSGTVMGTPYYMSPEQVRGLRDVDERGDVYAFGVILYEMLTSAFPFDAETYNDLILKIVTEEPRPILSLLPELDPILASVIARAMARDRGQRYESIAALATDLEPFSGGVSFRRQTTSPGMPVISQPVLRGTTARAEAASGTRRKSSRTLVIAASALAVVALLAALLWSARPKPKLANDEPSGAPRASAAVLPSNTARAENAAAKVPAAAQSVPTAATASTERAVTAVPANAAAQSAGRAPSSGAEPAGRSEHASGGTHKRARAQIPGAAPSQAGSPTRSLPADWDERLGSTRGATPANGKSPAGSLGRDDL